MFFSVITVTYNSSQFVRDAIESILASTFTDFELIIGDDCSTDNTWDIIKEYKDPRIIKYRNERNLREYPNRNKALSMASGEWVFFIDGDDIIYEHGLWYLNYYIKKYSNSSIQMIVQRGYLNNLLLPVVVSPKDTLDNFFFGKNILLSGSFSSVVFRTSTLISNGMLSSNYVSGDDEIRLRLASKYPTLFINGSSSWARETPNSASSRLSIYTSITEMKQMLLSIKNSQNENNFHQSDLKNYLLTIERRALRYFILNILKLRFIDAWKFFTTIEKSTFLNIISLRIFFFEKSDFLQDYSPSKPLKNKLNN